MWKKILLLLIFVVLGGSIKYYLYQTSLPKRDYLCSLYDAEEKVIKTGDVRAYNKLVNPEDEYEGLLYPIIMANKYNYQPAVEDIFVNLFRDMEFNYSKGPDRLSSQLAWEFLQNEDTINDSFINEFKEQEKSPMKDGVIMNK